MENELAHYKERYKFYKKKFSKLEEENKILMERLNRYVLFF